MQGREREERGKKEREEKKEETRERERKKERDGGTLACKQRGYAAPLLSSPRLSLPLLSSDRSVRLTRSLVARAPSKPSLLLSLSLRPFRDGALGPSPSLSLYTPFGVSLFFLFRVYTYVHTYVRTRVHACSVRLRRSVAA